MEGVGQIEVDNGVRIITDVDICKYYQWLIHRRFWGTVKTQIPKHKGHITICNPKIHKVTDYEKVLDFHGKSVIFTYDPSEMVISRVNFWIPVKCEIEQEIKSILNVNDGPDYWGLHLTVANRKFE